MKTTSLGFALSLIMLLSISGLSLSADLKTLREKYEESLGKIILTHGMNRGELGQRYVKSLNALRERSQKRGDLNQVKKIGDRQRTGREPADNLPVPPLRRLSRASRRRTLLPA